MKFVGHYKERNQNVGIIREFIHDYDPDDPMTLIRIELDDGSINELDKDCCYQFDPKIGQRVAIGLDEDDEVPGWMIIPEKEYE